MRRSFWITIGFILLVLLGGCGAKEDPKEISADKPSPAKNMTVGKDIQITDITEFYYTEENINYDAYYQRYKFYVEDGKHMFFHETRERKDDYGPCTEEDTTLIGTMELTEDQWATFSDLVSGGIVKAREDSADAGGSGPWLFLYWTNDEGTFQVFSFDSYGTEVKFEEFCLSLAAET